MQGEPLLYTLYGGLLYGLGMGLVFRANATTGGTEIPAKLLEHFRGIRMSSSLLAMDMVVVDTDDREPEQRHAIVLSASCRWWQCLR